MENYTFFQMIYQNEISNKTQLRKQLYDHYYLNTIKRGGAIYYSLNDRRDFIQFILRNNQFINNRAHKGSFAYFVPEGIELVFNGNTFKDNFESVEDDGKYS